MQRINLSKLLDKDLIEIATSSSSIEELLVNCGYDHYSHSIRCRVIKRLKDANFNVEKFYSPYRVNYSKMSDNELFTLDKSKSIPRETIKKRFIKGNYTEYKCSICGQGPEWNGKPLVLILDHINGDTYDNRLENLRLVCPNCDHQLDTFCARNIKTNNSDAFPRQLDLNNEGIIIKKKEKKRSTPLPSKEKLLTDIVNNNTLKEVADQYGISTMLLRKWCIKYDLPSQDKKACLNLYRTEILGLEPLKEFKGWKVAQIDPNTKEIINIFNNKADAAVYLNMKRCSTGAIIRAIKNKSLYKGYYWEDI